ncbi:MAG: restriction endonuclease subunit S [Gallionella sp.]|nr:restriction endonuclease subunit S [Gallionella sp.]
MSAWQEIELASAIKTNQGTVDATYPFQEIKYLDTGSITRGKIDGLQSLPISSAPSRAKRLVKDGDIVYSTVRPIQRHYGYIQNPPENLVVSTGFAVISCDEKKLDSKFLYYYLSFDLIVEELDIIAEASTSTYPSLKPSDIEKLTVCLPVLLNEQKAIAAVLSSLDNKINLLHRQNKTLEAMAETLFRQWFVEEAQEDWNEFSLSDFATHLKGNVVPTKTPDKVFHHYSLPAFDAGMRPTMEAGSEILSNKYAVKPWTILVSKLNPRFPRIWPIGDLTGSDAICSTEFQVFAPKSPNLFGYIYFFLRSGDAKDELTMAASGTSGSHQRVRPEDILNIKTNLPSMDLAAQYSALVMPNIRKLWANNEQIQSLEKLRDTLLPKLMSGEVRVEIN